MLPVTAPAVCGVNIALKVRLCPAVRVRGKSRPGTLNPVPLTLAWEMVTLDPPVLVMVSDEVALLPVCTLPKLILDCDAARVPGLTPVPESPMFNVELEALLVTLRLPLTAPLACGANATVKLVL